MPLPDQEMKKAAELTRQGRLMEATRVLQRALAALQDRPAPVDGPATPAHAWTRAGAPAADITDVAFREHAVVPGRAQRPALAQPAGDPPVRPATFSAHRFASGGRSYNYRLYVPPRADAKPLPVIVMLHGCTQDAADFAAGTAMNALAARRGCIVVYPEQLARANSMRCWNWFEPAHQQRGRGEPAMIAALAAHVVQQCNGDAGRVYVAGLSAGGAMAALVGQLYPDVFAAVGVHSGLPAGAASDVQSAHAAMRKPAPRRPAAAAGLAAAVPTIVIHGRSDRTVHPGNGRQLVEELAAGMAAAGVALQREEQRMTVDGRPVTRTVYTGPDHIPRVEHWEIAAGTHAWSGGSASGSYTQPTGPDASAAMADFFLAHHLA